MGDADDLSRALVDLASDASLRATLAAGAVITPGLLTDMQVAQLHGSFFAQVAA